MLKLKFHSSLLNDFYNNLNLGCFLQEEAEKHTFKSAEKLFNKVVFYDSKTLLSLKEIEDASEVTGRFDQRILLPVLYIEVERLALLFKGIAFQNIETSSFFLETKLVNRPNELRVWTAVASLESM